MTTVYGTDANDQLEGTTDSDIIYGYDGDDRIFAYDGDDFVYGGAGNDTIFASYGDDFEDGGEGIDTLAQGGTSEYMAVTYDLENGSQGITGEALTLNAFANFENFDGGLSYSQGIVEVNWDYTIYGSSLDNDIKTSVGSDTIYGGEGDDSIDGGASIDTVTFSGVRSNYTITEQDGVLTVRDDVGSDGTDTLINIEKLKFDNATLDVTDLVFDEGSDDEGTVRENTEGADLFIGTPGIDKVIYNNARADIDISVQVGVVRITNGDITDELTDVERIQFDDKSLAFDLDSDGHAAETAKILGAVFGSSQVSTNPVLAGIGLSYLDGGEYDYESLMELALEAAGCETDEDVVNLLYANATGSSPLPEQAAPFVAMLKGENPEHTWGSLGALAAEFVVDELVLSGIVAAGGLEYTPYG